jgi:hypothetical protein
MDIPSVVDAIRVELLKYDNLESIELEARLGIYDTENNKFDSNIGIANYEKINEMLDTFKQWNSTKKTSVTTLSTDKLRMTTDATTGEKTAIEKIKLKHLTFVLEDLPMDIRVSISRETPIPLGKFPTSKRNITTRIKERTSKVFQNASFDLTCVKVPVGKSMEQTFEFEVEHLGDFQNPDEAIFQMLYKVLDANYMLDGFQKNEGMMLPIEVLTMMQV